MKAGWLIELYDRIAEAPDAVNRLRRFVLDLAIRGKLTGQDSEDESASTLLKRIKAERARLVENKKIKKPKRLAPVNIEPFDLPSNWCWVRIRDVTSDRGQKIPDKQFTYIDVTAIDKLAGIVAEPRILSDTEAPSRARKIAAKDDVIYSCVRPYLLNVAVLDKAFEPESIASTAFAVLNGYGLVLPWYLWIALRGSFAIEYVEANQRGQSYPAINDRDFSLLPLPLPPLAEQHRIVAKVDELMALCDRLEATHNTREATRDRLTTAALTRLIPAWTDDPSAISHSRFALEWLEHITRRPSQIETVRQTIHDLAVSGRLNPQHISYESSKDNATKRNESREEPYSIPAGWRWTPADELALQIVDCPHSTARFQPRGILCLDTNSFKGGALITSKLRYVSESTYSERVRRLEPLPGDIVFAREGSVGESVVIPDGVRCCLGQRVMLFRPGPDIVSEYFRMALSAPRALERLLALHKGIGAKHVNVRDMRKTLIPFPAIEEQHRIVAKVDQLMALCDRLEASLQQAGDKRARLLDALLAEALSPTSDKRSAA